MNQTVEVPVNRFEILNEGPACFDYIALKDNFLDRGDTLTIREIDGLGNQTGNAIFGLVLLVNVGIVQLIDSDDGFYYICKTVPTEGIGFSEVGINFEVN